jgi:hypothetical protein
MAVFGDRLKRAILFHEGKEVKKIPVPNKREYKSKNKESIERYERVDY